MEAREEDTNFSAQKVKAVETGNTEIAKSGKEVKATNP
jgi:hypothetical protein